MVSVVIPCYNSERFISETIQSVLNQTYKALEVIIVDDGSTDGSPSIITKFQDSRIKYIKQVNQGVSNARNNGLKNSNGKYIVFLDSDDILTPNFIANRVEALQKNTQFIGVCSNVVYLVNEEREKSLVDNAYNTEHIIQFDESKITCPSGYLFDNEMIKNKNIQFNEKLSSSADRYFLLKIFQYGLIYYIPDSPFIYRVYAESMSHQISNSLLNDHIAFFNVLKNSDYISYKKYSNYFSRLAYTIAATSFYLAKYKTFLHFLFLSFRLSPATLFKMALKL